MVSVIDYGVGNLGSILNMFKRLDVAAILARSPEDVMGAQKILLPGVGAFDAGMEMLERSGMIPALQQKVLEEGVPTLGICLGMQLMTKSSEEGQKAGLGWFDAQTVKFRLDTREYKIPHMGWNEVNDAQGSPLFQEMGPEPRFYFVHSYHLEGVKSEEVMFTCTYGYEFVCGVRRGNLFGAQFHPEKSHRFGMRLLSNFSAL
jgi:glutamine amidotransferase